MSKNKFTGGKGYYIALVLCAAAIGVSGFLYYRNTDDTPTNLGKEPVSQQQGQDVPAAATAATDPADRTNPTDSATKPGKQKLKTASPVAGETVAGYAMETLSYNQTTRDWRVHNGIDIAAEAGTQVCAAADGVVYTVYDDEAMGMTVVIRHEDGYMSKYASLAEEVSVQPGDEVKLGQAIGCVGNSALLESAVGDHVHFSVTCNDQLMDPAEFLEQG